MDRKSPIEECINTCSKPSLVDPHGQPEDNVPVEDIPLYKKIQSIDEGLRLVAKHIEKISTNQKVVGDLRNDVNVLEESYAELIAKLTDMLND